MAFLGAVITLMGIIGLVLLHPVHCIEEAFCAGLGYSNENNQNEGLKTMGASSVFHHPLSTIWGANVMDSAANRNDTIRVIVNSVEQELPNGKRSTMNGWLFLKISKLQGGFVALAVTATTDMNSPFGEFVYLEPTDKAIQQCGIWTHQENYLPCGAVPLDAPILPNMFVFTDPFNSTPVTEINLLWKASVSFCSKPKQFRFIFATNSEKWNNYSSISPFHVKHGNRKPDSTGGEEKTDLGAMIFSTQLMEIGFYGLASPRYPEQRITCEGNGLAVEDTKPEWFSKKPPGAGIYSGILEDPPSNWFNERWDFRSGVEIEYVVNVRATCRAEDSSNFVEFGGRCEGLLSVNSRTFGNKDKTPECSHSVSNFDANDTSRFKGSFVTTVMDRETSLTTNCACPHVPTSLEVDTVAKGKTTILIVDNPSSKPRPYDFKEFGCLKHSNFSYDGHGLCSTSESGKVAYSIRRWHAILSLFCVIVVNPVGAFMARYFKGSIPVGADGQPSIPIKLWYTAHVLLGIPVVCVGVCSSAVISRQRIAVGYSTVPFATFHRSAGWTYCGLFIFQILTGFLRPLNTCLRSFALFLHWFTGVTLIYGGLIICILTYRIPASPSTSVVHLYEEQFNPIYNHTTPMVLTFWLLVDIVIHTCLTIRLIISDKRGGVDRTYFPVFLPLRASIHTMLFEAEFHRETRFHHRCFILYLFMCITFYAAVILSITIFNDYREQGFGDMFCTHKDGKFIVPFDRELDHAEVAKFFLDRECAVISTGSSDY